MMKKKAKGTIEKKTKITLGLAGLVAVSGLMGVLIYRYHKYKNENEYYDNLTQDDIAWG